MAPPGGTNTHLYRLEACQGFLICPSQVNTYYADENLPWEYAWVEFDGVKAMEFMEMAGLDYDHPIYRVKKREFASLIRDEIMDIVDNPGQSPIYQIGHLYLLFDRLIQCSAAAKASPAGKMKDFYIKEAISFVEQNYSRDITVEDIAAFCNLNRNYLGKLFREGTNQTLQHFLMHYRMNRAAELLKFSDMNVSEVGKMCGYPNQLHFSRAFKTIYGISPNHWREKNGTLPKSGRRNAKKFSPLSKPPASPIWALWKFPSPVSSVPGHPAAPAPLPGILCPCFRRNPNLPTSGVPSTAPIWRLASGSQ